MNLSLDSKTADGYTSASQRARVMTEYWVEHQVCCPQCGGMVSRYNDNKPVADFYCKKCCEDFELKSKRGAIGKKITSGAYSQMIKRINSSSKPNFFFMGYNDLLRVRNFFVIPKHFFVSSIIEKRKPLADTARRAGWVGSYILFFKIPKAGHIYYVKDGQELSKNEILEKWNKTVFLKKISNAEIKGWILDIMNIIDAIQKKEFALSDIYAFESRLQLIHPENKNIRPKIRQQLQFLRDKGYIHFIGKGRYALV